MADFCKVCGDKLINTCTIQNNVVIAADPECYNCLMDEAEWDMMTTEDKVIATTDFETYMGE